MNGFFQKWSSSDVNVGKALHRTRPLGYVVLQREHDPPWIEGYPRPRIAWSHEARTFGDAPLPEVGDVKNPGVYCPPSLCLPDWANGWPQVGHTLLCLSALQLARTARSSCCRSDGTNFE